MFTLPTEHKTIKNAVCTYIINLFIMTIIMIYGVFEYLVFVEPKWNWFRSDNTLRNRFRLSATNTIL